MMTQSFRPTYRQHLDEQLEDRLQYQGHPLGPIYVDAQTLVSLLPIVVFAADAAPKESPLAHYAEHLCEQVWAVLLEIAPLGNEYIFDHPSGRLRRPSTTSEAWQRLWDATTIAQAQANPDGATAALIEDARAQLRVLGDGIGEPNGNARSTP